MTVPLTHQLSSQDIVLAHVSKTLNLQLDSTQCSIQNVREYKTVSGINTIADLVPLPNSRVRDQTSIRYTRQHIGKLTRGRAFEIPIENQKTSLDVMRTLNRVYGFKLIDEDIVLERLGSNEYPQEYALKMSPTNPAWLGEMRIEIREPRVSLARLIGDVSLPGASIVGLDEHCAVACLLHYSDDFSPISNRLGKLKLHDEWNSFLTDQLNACVEEPWCFENSLTERNLYGAKVINNGLHEGRLCLRLSVNPRYCKGVRGELFLFYS